YLSRALDRHPPRSTLFPYPTLFRSNAEHTATEVRNAEERAEQGLRGIDAALVQVEQLSATVTQAVRVVSGLAEESNRTAWVTVRSEEHTSELQSRENLVCRLLLEKK